MATSVALAPGVGTPSTLANFFCASATQASNSACGTARTLIGMKRMGRAAQFRALAVIDAGFVGIDIEPAFVDAARHGVVLDAEAGHGPGVDDVGRGDLDADVLADRHDDFVVGLQQAQLARLQIRRRNHVGVEGEVAIVRIFIRPVPLVPDGTDGEVGLGQDRAACRAA